MGQLGAGAGLSLLERNAKRVLGQSSSLPKGDVSSGAGRLPVPSACPGVVTSMAHRRDMCNVNLDCLQSPSLGTFLASCNVSLLYVDQILAVQLPPSLTKGGG